jgi:hypothetical protein
MWEKWKDCTLLVGRGNEATTVVNNLAMTQKAKHRIDIRHRNLGIITERRKK